MEGQPANSVAELRREVHHSIAQQYDLNPMNKVDVTAKKKGKPKGYLQRGLVAIGIRNRSLDVEKR